MKVEADQGEREIETLSIANLGGTDLVYNTVVRETEVSFEERVAESQTAVSQAGETTANSLLNWSQDAVADADGFALIPYDGGSLRVVQFATDFENFEVGPVGTQNGWIGNDDTLALVSEANPSSGERHLRMVSDSTKDNFSIFSPAIAGGEEGFSSFATKLNLSETGAQYRIFPSEVVGDDLSIGAGILISTERELAVFFGGQYVNTGYVLPERYIELKYVSDKINTTYDLYIDDELIVSDIPTFSSTVNVVEIRCYNENTTTGAPISASGIALDIDDFEIIDGDAAAPNWVGVEPAGDTVAARTRLNADIVFDATGLEPGVYKAEITVLTNDPFNPSKVIPVQLTVDGDGKPDVEALDLKEFVLVNAASNKVIGPLKDGAVIDLSDTPEFTIAAVPMFGDFRGRIEFFIDGEKVKLEKFSPYSLTGDSPRGDYNPFNGEPGDYTLRAVSTVKTADGVRNDEIEVSFSIVTGEEAVADNQSEKSFRAYPNPVSQNFTISAGENSSATIARYTVIDNLGRIIVAADINNLPSVEVDIEPLLGRIPSSGLFYVRVKSTNGALETIRLTMTK